MNEGVVHAGPFPHADCKLAFQEMLVASNKATKSAVEEAMEPFASELQRLRNTVYGNGHSGLVQVTDELRREREAEKAFRDRLAGLVMGNIASLATAAVVLVVGVYLGWMHIHDGEVHTRILVSGSRPVMVNERDTDGKIIGQMWVWPKNGAGSSAHAAAQP